MCQFYLWRGTKRQERLPCIAHSYCSACFNITLCVIVVRLIFQDRNDSFIPGLNIYPKIDFRFPWGNNIRIIMWVAGLKSSDTASGRQFSTDHIFELTEEIRIKQLILLINK